MNNHLEQYIKSEIKSIQDRHEKIKETQDYIGIKSFIREFKTIIVTASRTSGKTTLINKLACEHGRSLVFVHNEFMCRLYDPWIKDRVFNICSDIQHKFVGKRHSPAFPLQYVFMDECLLNSEQIDLMCSLDVIDSKTIFIGLNSGVMKHPNVPSATDMFSIG